MERDSLPQCQAQGTHLRERKRQPPPVSGTGSSPTRKQETATSGVRHRELTYEKERDSHLQYQTQGAHLRERKRQPPPVSDKGSSPMRWKETASPNVRHRELTYEKERDSLLRCQAQGAHLRESKRQPPPVSDTGTSAMRRKEKATSSVRHRELTYEKETATCSVRHRELTYEKETATSGVTDEERQPSPLSNRELHDVKERDSHVQCQTDGAHR
ncbi:hypothetical protein NDU88_004623 [Pleurodeles waltl]|uniref:Uncharacterized protein n=1 Tax=Pleurodeles waltl TaxID=8319 RepID=A0AAV7PLH9_PLEWA|nr:hypothetical protein NDU88_004623 [Pleurodeles waltl]